MEITEAKHKAANEIKEEAMAAKERMDADRKRVEEETKKTNEDICRWKAKIREAKTQQHKDSAEIKVKTKASL